jgi:CxxC-x17-CxxC domain-containing protein
MMSNEDYQDRILTCRDCGMDFTFSAGEQEFYASRGLTNAPGRCPSCRAARRNGQSSSAPGRGEDFKRSAQAPLHHARTEHYETTCATCGRPTSVPFIPREDRPVYCSDCFQAQRASRGSRRDDSRSYSELDTSRSRGRGRDRRDRRDSNDRW